MCASSTGASDDCQEMCCIIDQNSKPFQPTDAVTINSLAESGRKFMSKWYQSYQWLTVCKHRKKLFCFYCRYAVRHNVTF